MSDVSMFNLSRRNVIYVLCDEIELSQAKMLKRKQHPTIKNH
jgi:hypothetical protein